jgi:hypothetical protein
MNWAAVLAHLTIWGSVYAVYALILVHFPSPWGQVVVTIIALTHLLMVINFLVRLVRRRKRMAMSELERPQLIIVIIGQ